MAKNINFPSGNFPNPLAPTEAKQTKEYGLKYARAIEANGAEPMTHRVRLLDDTGSLKGTGITPTEPKMLLSTNRF